MKAKVYTACVILTFLLSVHIASGDEVKIGDDLKGLRHILNCSDCHGFDGNSVRPDYPNLAGLHATYISKQIFDFKQGRRKSADMNDVVQHIPSDKVIKEISDYFSSQKLRAIKSTKNNNPELVNLELGKEIFTGKRMEYGIPACAACHGKDGSGDSEGKYPRLTGQYRQYIVNQMKLFRSKKRTNDVPAMMQNITIVMDDEDIESVAAYIETLSVRKSD